DIGRRAGARDELEELLTEEAPRSMVLSQHHSSSGAPPDVFDVSALTPDRILTMFESGNRFANAELGSKTQTTISTEPGLEAKVKAQLGALVHKCELLFQSADACKFRANIFMPITGGYEH